MSGSMRLVNPSPLSFSVSPPPPLSSITGGFTYGSITEDFNTTMTLHQNGFRTAYLNERFQWGLAPETLRATVRQRQRSFSASVPSSLSSAASSSQPQLHASLSNGFPLQHARVANPEMNDPECQKSKFKLSAVSLAFASVPAPF